MRDRKTKDDRDTLRAQLDEAVGLLQRIEQHVSHDTDCSYRRFECDCDCFRSPVCDFLSRLDAGKVTR